jgi:hypothetical protein
MDKLRRSTLNALVSEGAIEDDGRVVGIRAAKVLNWKSRRDSMGPTDSHCAVHPVRSGTTGATGRTILTDARISLPHHAFSNGAWRETVMVQ